MADRLMFRSLAEPGENPASRTVAKAVVQLILRQTADLDVTLDGVLTGLAAVMEQAPDLSTFQALEKGAEDAGDRLIQHARKMRLIFEQQGVHPVDGMMNYRGSIRMQERD